MALDNKKLATKKLKVLFKDCRTLIVRSLRKGVAQFKDSHREFFDKMMESFKINGLPVRHTEMDFIFLDAATKAVIPGVEAIATMVKNPSSTMKQYASMAGEVDFKEISPEVWNMEFIIPDYLPVQKTVKAVKAKKISMAIEMNRI